MFVLIGRTLSSLARHWPFYLVVSLATVAAEAAVVYAWHSPVAQYLAPLTIVPVLTAIVNAISLGDVTETFDAAQLWLRILERTWAVIVIDFMTVYIAGYALVSLSAGPLDKLVAIPLLLLAAVTIFADVHAVCEEDDTWWMIVPRAFGTSARLALQHGYLGRTILLLALEFVPNAIGNGVQPLLEAHHVAFPAFWAGTALATIFAVPLQALTAFAYLDAAGYGSKRPCSE